MRNTSAHVVASLIIVVINGGFTISLLWVEPAKALLLISLNPLWAALQGRLLLGDRLPFHTAIAQLLSLVSTLLVYMPNLLAMMLSSDDENHRSSSTDTEDEGVVLLPSSTASFEWLDLVPLGTGFAVATLLTYSRWQAKAALEAAPALGAALTAVAALILLLVFEAEPPSALFRDLLPPFWVALLLSALGSAAYDLALVLAPRSLTSAEVALILLGETIFGPLWVWYGYGEQPETWTLMGGALLLLTLIGHELASAMRSSARLGAAAAAGAHGFAGASPSPSGSSDLFLTDEAFSFASMGAHRSPVSGARMRSLSPESSRSASLDSRKVSLLDDVYGGEMTPVRISLEREGNGRHKLQPVPLGRTNSM